MQHAHKAKRLRLYLRDEDRIGQKGRVCHIWWKRGERPQGLLDQRYINAYIYAAAEPGADNAFALILPLDFTGQMNGGADDRFVRFSVNLQQPSAKATDVPRRGSSNGARHLRVPVD